MRSTPPKLDEGYVSVIAGSPADITCEIKGLSSTACRVIAVIVPVNLGRIACEIEKAVGSLAPIIEEIVDREDDNVFRQIVEALVLPTVPIATRLTEARMFANAKNTVLQSKDYVTAEEIAEIATYSGNYTCASPARWIKSRQIFAINHGGVQYFPFFALDPENAHNPYTALASIISIFGENKGPWAIALWFEAVNSYLGGQSPKTLLSTDPARVVAAAKIETLPIAHG